MINGNKVILKRAWKSSLGKTYPIGQVLGVTNELGSELIKSKTAEEYKGEYPPKQKVKTEFFKPK